MTEEIIIDGVKIERCRYSELLYGAVCCNNSGLRGECNDNPECEYKQLKRLEQENKELKEENSLLSYNLHIKEEEAEHYLKEVGKYRSALKEIKNYLNTLSSIDSDFPNTETYLRIQDKINEVLNDK